MMDNVPSMAVREPKTWLLEMKTQYKKAGYDVSSQVLNSKMNEDDNQRRSEELRLQDEERRIAAAFRNAAVTRIVQLVQFLTGALGVLLLLRVVLRLFGANPNNQFAQVIYGLSNPFVAPFANLFRNPVLGSSIVFDINALVAVLAYALLGWLVGRLLWLVWSRSL